MTFFILAVIVLILAILLLFAGRIRQVFGSGTKPSGSGVDPFMDLFLDPTSVDYDKELDKLTGTTRGGRNVSFTLGEYCSQVSNLVRRLKAQGRGNEADTIQKNSDEIKRLLSLICP